MEDTALPQPHPEQTQLVEVPQSLCRTFMWVRNICCMKTKPLITKALKNSTLWDRLQYLSTFISFGVSTSAPLTVIQIARWVLITPHWREQGSCKYALNWGYIFLPCTLCLSWGTNVGPWEQELGHIPGTLPLSVKYVLFTDVSYTIGSKLLIHMHKDIPKSKVQRRKKIIFIYSVKSGFKQTLLGEHYMWTVPIFLKQVRDKNHLNLTGGCRNVHHWV